MRKLLDFIVFWLITVPLWLPKRIAWKLRRKKCVKNGCNIETLRDEITNTIVYHWCSRCGAYKGKKLDESDYPLI